MNKFAKIILATTFGLSSVLVSATEPTFTFTTLAGTPSNTIKNVDGIGSAAQFYSPHGLAMDSSGNIYIADSFNHTIRKVNSTGVVSTLAGSPGQQGFADGIGSEARFTEPWAVVVDSSGNVFVSDTNNNRIRKITPEGVVTTLAGGGSQGSSDGSGTAARFNEPHGIGIDSSGNLYVADFGNNTIRKVTPTGMVSTLAGSAGSEGNTDGQGTAARFKALQFLTVDSTGDIYVSQSADKNIRKITAAGLVTTFASGAATFGDPRGLVADGTGNIYVADSLKNVIHKVTRSGTVSLLAGNSAKPGSSDGTTSSALFNEPIGVAINNITGTLYVTDSANNTIREISNGSVSTLAGLAGRTSSVDGIGAAARFEDPYALALDGAGNVFVADATDHSIRKITPDGNVTTFAGKGGSFGSDDGSGAAARFKSPLGIAADTAGNVYVADTGNYTIRKITSDGVVTTFAGSAGQRGFTDGNGTAARFSNPYGVSVDGSGNLYVIESTGVVRKITPTGVVTTLAGGSGSGLVDATGTAARFRVPFDIAVDGAGNLYVSDHGNHAVRKITPAGIVTTLAGSGIAGNSNGSGRAASFKFPSGIVADNSGNVYLADTDNQRIRLITPEGVVSNFAGSGSLGSADDVGTSATFFNPKDVALDASGNMYIADRGNHTIRKGSLSSSGGTTTTPTDSSDCLFNWAEANYASVLFPPAKSLEADFGPFHYRYRYYTGSHSYLATSSDGNFYYLGPNDVKPVNLGKKSGWLSNAACS